MGRPPRNQTVATKIVTVRLTAAEVKIVRARQLRDETLGQALRRLALARQTDLQPIQT